MRIGTYNVLGLTGYPSTEAVKHIGPRGEEKHAAHFARVFTELECDVLALQEGVGVGTMQQIARQMGRYLATLPSPLHWPGHVLSRYAIVESRVFSHADPTEEVPPFSRTAGAALLEMQDGTNMWIVDIHLHPGDVELRIREADLLRQQIERLMATADQVVVLGDFNSETDEKVHQHLKAMAFVNAMEEVGGGLQATMDTVGIRTHYIDHIYCSAALKARLQSATVVRHPGFRHDGPQEEGVWVHSDHLPVIVDLE